jgi:hypothetical protein
MKLGMYAMAPEHISVAYFINLSHYSACLYMYPPYIAREWLSKNVTVAMNAHATVEEMLDALFSVRSVSYQRNIGN